VKKLFLVGTSHFFKNYSWLKQEIATINPDAITLEESIGASMLAFWEFKNDLSSSELTNFNNVTLGAELSAGIHYARRNGTPVYAIDYCDDKFLAQINLNEDNNFELLQANLKSKKELNALRLKYANEVEYSNLSRRNEFMGDVLNKLFGIYNTVVHIGGKGHYDSKRCIPLQDFVNISSYTILDADIQKRSTFKI